MHSLISKNINAKMGKVLFFIILKIFFIENYMILHANLK